MFRVSRLTDYGIMLLTQFVREGEASKMSARQLAEATKVPQPTVSKILKHLASKGLLKTQRGARGGFSLGQPAHNITIGEIVTALEGPVQITDCSGHDSDCDLESTCSVRSNWRKINNVVLNALERITLAEMAQPMALDVAPVELRTTGKTF